MRAAKGDKAQAEHALCIRPRVARATHGQSATLEIAPDFAVPPLARGGPSLSHGKRSCRTGSSPLCLCLHGLFSFLPHGKKLTTDRYERHCAASGDEVPVRLQAEASAIRQDVQTEERVTASLPIDLENGVLDTSADVFCAMFDQAHVGVPEGSGGLQFKARAGRRVSAVSHTGTPTRRPSGAARHNTLINLVIRTDLVGELRLTSKRSRYVSLRYEN